MFMERIKLSELGRQSANSGSVPHLEAEYDKSYMKMLQQLDQFGEAAKDYCERRQLWLLFIFSIFYLVGTCFLASRKPMWNDELFTFYISRLHSISDIWSALLTGGEVIPPFFHIITRMSLSLFGVNELAIRLPEILGFWIMSLCLFRFVSKRSSALYGFAAMLFPLATKAYDYAYEARPYGMVLGFAGVCLLCWQSAAEEHHRKYFLIGLIVSLAAAVSSHYYAVLLVFPFALGEMARSLFRRRVDPYVWLALATAMVPLLLFLPLIQRAKTLSAQFAGQPLSREILDVYYTLLTPALIPLAAMLVLPAIYVTKRRGNYGSRNQDSPSTAPCYEIAASLGFIAIPIIGAVLAMLVTGAFTFRYVLPSVIGFSVLFALAAYRLLDGRPIMGASLVFLLCVGFMVGEIRHLQKICDASSEQAKTYDFLRSNNENQLPIVASDLHTFMTIAHYAPRDVASRVVYLAYPQASLRHLGHSSVDQGILDLKPWFGLRIEEYPSYVASHQQFLVYGPIGWLNWLVSELTATNRRIELKGRNGENLLFLVSTAEPTDAGNSRTAGD